MANRDPIFKPGPPVHEGKVQHVYVKIDSDGVLHKMWVHEDSDIQWHLDEYDMNDHIHVGSIKCVDPESIWPKEAQIPEEDLMYHKMEGGKFVFCPINSKKNSIEKLRNERSMLFQDLDIQFMRNLEEGKDNTEVLRHKKILRDMPTHAFWDCCESIEDFKKVNLKDMLSTSTP